MGREEYKVFSEGRIAHLAVKNRLIRSATYEGGMTGDSKVTSEILSLYKSLAEGGVGTIITGHMAVSLKGKGNHRQICIYDDTHIPEITRIADVVHASGDNCKVVAQLNYAGRQVMKDNTVAECVGPSDVPSPILRKRARTLSVDEIRSIVDCYVDAIVRVKRAGFDGVQLHGAHGYLLSSFLSPYTNRRQDQYGGSIEKRVTILREILTRAREKVNHYPVITTPDSSENAVKFKD